MPPPDVRAAAFCMLLQTGLLSAFFYRTLRSAEGAVRIGDPPPLIAESGCRCAGSVYVCHIKKVGTQYTANAIKTHAHYGQPRTQPLRYQPDRYCGAQAKPCDAV